MKQDIQHNNINNPTNRFQLSTPFFDEVINQKGEKEIRISNQKLITFWESLGYSKVIDETGNYVLVNIEKSTIVKEVKEHMLRSEIREYTKQKKRFDVWELFLKSEYVAKKHFESFHSIEMTRNTGNSDTSFLYYQNIILKITANSIEYIEYENFQGYVWEKEIIKRDFKFSEDGECVFGEFLKIIANNEPNRLKSIVTIIGYLLHSFKDPSLSKSIILMDSEIDVEFDDANGGTGKSLIGKAVEQILPILFIDGKTIKSQDKFRLSGLNSHHRIIIFDDVTRNFDFESLYPLITGDLYIEKKYKNAVVIQNKFTPKILITSNYVVKGGGGNAEKRRKIEYEVSSYFKNVKTPADEFGHRFFDEWDQEEWRKFDNFMVKAVRYYLKNGLIEPQSINIDFNRLKMETSVDFIDFMDQQIAEPSRFQKSSNSNILVIDKNKLFQEFLNTKPNVSERINLIIIKKWIDKYCNYHQIPNIHFKSNGNVYVELNIENMIKQVS
jgi:hypothetical protein